MGRFDDLQMKVLYLIWEYAHKPGSVSSIWLYKLDEYFPPEYVSAIARKAIGVLVSKNLLDQYQDEHENHAVEITLDGINLIERMLDENASALSEFRFKHLGAAQWESVEEEVDEQNRPIENAPEPVRSPPLLLGSSSLGVNALGDVPASDRTVTLDHNGDPYKEAVAALDRLVGEFREDHRLDNELGAEKSALIGALEAGRKLLDDSTFNVRIGIQLIIEPIKLVIEKYGPNIVEGTVSGFAHAAMSAVLKLIGIG